MRTDELDYTLPTELIAQEPIEPRDSARLLVDRGPGLSIEHSRIREIHELIEPGDVLVVNETRVLPARVAIKRSSGGGGEVLLLAPKSVGPQAAEQTWEALCRPTRKLKAGEILCAIEGALEIRLVDNLGEGRWLVVPSAGGGPVEGDALLAELDVSGAMPLPPYIDHALSDRNRYQTIFAKRAASAAAPTAGLHFTDDVIGSIQAKGAEMHTVELVVGLDTFRPITADVVENHRIHTEWYRTPAETWQSVQAAKREGRRVIAVGTTSVRALESTANTGALSGETRLFISPGYQFKVVDLLLTNFQLPRTSLLAMIQAFVGPRWRDLYRTAVEERYRFLSFGDAMLLSRAGDATRTRATERVDGE